MQHDEIHETGLPHYVKNSFSGISSDLTEDVRREFGLNGWEFGSNVLVIKRCACCPKQPTEEMIQRGEERFAEFEAVAAVLGDDLDGLASSIEEYLL